LTIKQPFSSSRHAPHVVRDPRCHRGRDAKRLVNGPRNCKTPLPARYGAPVVFPFLAECVRQAREADECPYAGWRLTRSTIEVQMRLRIGTAHDWDRLHGSDFGGAIALLAVLRRGAVDLDELRKVAAVVQASS